MIRVENLHKHFGAFRAVDGASLTIETGSITGLIGPNGAGKSTLFNVIAGAYAPTSGRVLMDGEDIGGLPPHELFHKGLLRTFQVLVRESASLRLLKGTKDLFPWGEDKGVSRVGSRAHRAETDFELEIEDGGHGPGVTEEQEGEAAIGLGSQNGYRATSPDERQSPRGALLAPKNKPRCFSLSSSNSQSSPPCDPLRVCYRVLQPRSYPD